MGPGLRGRSTAATHEEGGRGRKDIHSSAASSELIPPRAKVSDEVENGDDRDGLRAVLWTAAASRLATLALSILSDWVLEDFDRSASGGQAWPQCSVDSGAVVNSGGTGAIASAVRHAIESAIVWDGVHFVRICQCGYGASEHQFAFLPLWPWTMRLVRDYTPILCRLRVVIGDAAACALSGLILSNLCFVLSAVALYRLGKQVGYSHRAARVAAMAYCVNPSSVFFSAVYTESLFACLTFEGIRLMAVAKPEGNRGRRAVVLGTVLLALATLARSNGITACVVVLAIDVKNWLPTGRFYQRATSSFCRRTLKALAIFAIKCVVIVAPFYVYQFAVASLWYEGGAGEEFTVAGKSMSINTITSALNWRQLLLPRVYKRIQSKYWNLGLFQFYSLEQIPNFVLALPIWFTTLFGVWQHFSKLCHTVNRRYQSPPVGTTGTLAAAASMGSFPSLESVGDVLVRGAFFLHMFLLMLVSVLIMNVQVSTRFLSTCPALYWTVAELAVPPGSMREVEIQKKLQTKKKKKSLVLRFILAFFLTYAAAGCVLFQNFYPWV